MHLVLASALVRQSIQFLCHQLGEQNRPSRQGRALKATALLAAGRLDWLLQSTRPHLSGVFSERDVVTLLDCYQGGIFFPGQFNSISTDLCDHLGVEVDEYEASSIAPLVEKLLGLDAVQRVTLGDALEQAWHRGMKQQGLSPKEFFATLGIQLT